MNKRGVSTVVASVLMILLTIVGIAVIWAVVKPTIERSSGEIEGDCFSVRLQPVKCEIDPSADGASFGFTGFFGATNVLVKRNPGEGSLQEVRLVFEGDIYNTVSLTGTNPSALLRSSGAVYSSPLTNLAELATRSVYSAIIDLSTNSPLSLTALSGAMQPAETFIPKRVTVHAVIGSQKKICEPMSTSVDCSCSSSNPSVIHCP